MDAFSQNDASSEVSPMELIRLKLTAMGYQVRSSPSDPGLWYATTDTKGELFAVIYEPAKVRVNDINGRHESERRNVQQEVSKCLKLQ